MLRRSCHVKNFCGVALMFLPFWYVPLKYSCYKVDSTAERCSSGGRALFSSDNNCFRFCHSLLCARLRLLYDSQKLTQITNCESFLSYDYTIFRKPGLSTYLIMLKICNMYILNMIICKSLQVFKHCESHPMLK